MTVLIFIKENIAIYCCIFDCYNLMKAKTTLVMTQADTTVY